MRRRPEQSPERESPSLGWPIAAESLTRIGESIATRRAGSGRPHKGVDLFAPLGSPVVAVSAGKVLRVINGSGSSRRSLQRAGWFVDILGEDGRVYRYLHLRGTPGVRAGQRVTAGMPIGSVGTSGVQRARPHIHFEVRRGDYDAARQDYGEPVDPLTVLPVATLKNKGDLMAQHDIRGRTADADISARPAAIDLEAPDAQAALKYLVSKGWTPEEVRQLLDKHVPTEPPSQDESTEPDRPVDEHLLSLGWSRSDIARFRAGPEQAHQTAEALFRQHAANSSADQERLVKALARAGAKDVKLDPQLLDGLDPGHLQPESPSDLDQLIAQFAQLPDVQKQRFLLLLDSQKPKKTATLDPEELKRLLKQAGGGDGGGSPKTSGGGSDVLPVVKSSLDLLNTAIKGLLDWAGTGKRTKGDTSSSKGSDSNSFPEGEETDPESDTDSGDETDPADASDPDSTDDVPEFDEEGNLPTMSEDGIDLGDQREPD